MQPVSKSMPFILGLMLGYFWLFFSIPFESTEVPRCVLFYSLLEPELLIPEGPFGFERFAFLGLGLVCLAAASGLGLLVLRFLPFANRLSFLERLVFAGGIGLNLCSSGMLVLGLLGLADSIVLVRILTGIGCLVFAASLFFECKRIYVAENQQPEIPRLKAPQCSPWWFVFPVVAGFVILFYGTQPPVEYDVVSYHLAGAKEFFQSGKIGFAPHNVYMNMPFGAEMFALWGMCFCGEWYAGGLLGKVLIAACSIITGLGLFAAGNRYHSRFAGIVAMTVYLTTPWTLFLSAFGLVDGALGMYIFLALYAMLLSDGRKSGIIACGYLAGAAAACKYPAILYLVLPLGIWICVACYLRKRDDEPAGKKNVRKKRRLKSVLVAAGIYAAAVCIACGLWYAKNAVYTGNPTYPLLYNVFGDSSGTWNPEKNARWTRIHGPHGFSFEDFTNSTKQVLLNSPYLSPLIVPLGLLCVIPPIREKIFGRKKDDGFEEENRQWVAVLVRLLIYSGFVLACWWFLTHRIDRFWIPLLPIFSLAAGFGAGWSKDLWWKVCIAGLLIFATVYLVVFGNAKHPGVFLPVESLRNGTTMNGIYTGSPWEIWYNANPPSGKILLIGEAKAYAFKPGVVYNTCFDDTIFDRLVKDKTPAEIREGFRKEGISDILVNWGELRRFRSKGNYGYTSDFVQPEVFEALVGLGILRPTGPGDEFPEYPIRAYKLN